LDGDGETATPRPPFCGDPNGRPSAIGTPFSGAAGNTLVGFFGDATPGDVVLFDAYYEQIIREQTNVWRIERMLNA
jgi:hypothetical protein